MTAPRTLCSGFLASWERFADHTALVVDGHEVSYDALGRFAKQIAATLEREAGADDAGSKLTAVFAHRSASAFAGILGALFVSTERTH